MTLDNFVKELILDSRYFLEKAKDTNDNKIKNRYIKAVITTIWAALEGWINCVSSDFVLLSEEKLHLHERAFLKEKQIALNKKGKFEITNRDKYNSTEDKLLFLLYTFGNYEIDKNTKFWSDFKKIKKLRDGLIHPKEGKVDMKSITIKNAETAINSVVEVLILLTQKIYHRKLKI